MLRVLARQMLLSRTPLDSSKGYSAPTGVTAIVVGVIMCYQIVNYTILNTALQDDLGFHRWGTQTASDAACFAEPGLVDGSSLCMEAQLFNGWHDMPEDAPELLKQLLVPTPSNATEEQHSADPASDISDISEPSITTTLQQRAAEGSNAVPSKIIISATSLKRSPDRQPHGSFTSGLSKLQQELEAKMQEQAHRHAEHRALRALSVAARGQTEELPTTYDSMTPWAHNIENLTHDIQHHMEVRKKERDQRLAAREAVHDARVAAAHAAVQKAAPASPTALAQQRNHHSVMGAIQDLGQELCRDPSRQNVPACAQFISTQSSDHQTAHQAHRDRNAKSMEQLHSLEKQFDDLRKEHDHEAQVFERETVTVLKELCADPARKSYPTCMHLTATYSTTFVPGSPQASRLRGRSSTVPTSIATVQTSNNAQLSWNNVLAWKSSRGALRSQKGTQDRAPMKVYRKDLHGHWQGITPRVACITVVPRGQLTKTLMTHFMDNYNLQHYEGSRQLVIIHHMDDHQAAEIIRPFVNGNYVKVGTAHGEGEFPSATAYRYGAWLSSDADVVAQWDFDAWHHPRQLSMQVRALAVAVRPASIVTKVTNFEADGKNATVAGGFGQHGSMVGEKKWMRKHWMPLLEEEHSVLDGIHSGAVVQVEMPELLAYHDL
jgi:hypothetical protein